MHGQQNIKTRCVCIYIYIYIYIHTHTHTHIYIYIQGDSGWKVSFLGGDSVVHCEVKFHVNLCLIFSGYRDGAVWMSRTESIRFLFVRLDDGRSLQIKGGYTRRIAGLCFGCCLPHKWTWRSTQTYNTPSSHTSYKVRWVWRWDFRTFNLLAPELFS